MSAEGPKEYPVIYDPIIGLEYSFTSGYIPIIVAAPVVVPQTQFASLATPQVITSTIFVDSTLGQNIAVSDASNKIRVRLVGNLYVSNGEDCFITIYKDGVNLSDNNGLILVKARGGNEVNAVAIELYDTPIDTASHSYEVWFRTGSGQTCVLKAQTPDIVTLTLEEVIVS